MAGPTTTLLDPENRFEPKERFVFDQCFWSLDPDDDCPMEYLQPDIYNVVGPQLLDSIMIGYNACLCAYGQTGSGKTYTMMGNLASVDDKGIIPRLCEDLYARMHTAQRENPSISFKLEAQYMEIYTEKVRDARPPPTGWTSALL